MPTGISSKKLLRSFFAAIGGIHHVKLKGLFSQPLFILCTSHIKIVFAHFCAVIKILFRILRIVQNGVFFVPKAYSSTPRGRKNVKCENQRGVVRRYTSLLFQYLHIKIVFARFCAVIKILKGYLECRFSYPLRFRESSERSYR